MRIAIAAVWAVILSAFFVQTANALQTELISLKADGVFAAGIIGLVMSGYYAGYILVPLLGRPIIARLGHARAFLFAMAVAAGVILLQPVIITAPVWALLRVASGFALSLSYVAVESWINDSVDDRLRGRIFSLYMFAQLVGMTVAQGLLGFGTTLSFAMFALVAVLFGAAMIPVMLVSRRAPAGVPPSPLSLPRLFQLAPMGFLATLLAGLTWAVLATFGPLYAKHIGLSFSGIGLFMAAAMAAGGVVQMPVGWLADHWGRRPVLMVLFGGGVAAAILAVIAQGETASLIAIALAGAFIFPIYGVSVAAVNDHVARQERVAAAAGLVLLFGIGSFFGPLLCGVMMGALGTMGFFVLLGASMGLGLAATLAYRR